MGRCHLHQVCNQGYVQGAAQLHLLIKCMLRRGVLHIRRGKYTT